MCIPPTHAYSHARTHTHAYSCMHSFTHITHTHVLTHTYTHTASHSYISYHTHTHILTHNTHTFSLIHNTHTHTHSHITHMYSLTHTYARSDEVSRHTGGVSSLCHDAVGGRGQQQGETRAATSKGLPRRKPDQVCIRVSTIDRPFGYHRVSANGREPPPPPPLKGYHIAYYLP